MAADVTTQERDPRQQAGGQGMPARAARMYHKTGLTEVSAEQLLQTYAPVISQMVYRFAPLVRVAVDVDDLKKAQDSITSFLQDRKADLLTKISTEGKLDDSTEADLKAALDDYKSANKQ